MFSTLACASYSHITPKNYLKANFGQLLKQNICCSSMVPALPGLIARFALGEQKQVGFTHIPVRFCLPESNE